MSGARINGFGLAAGSLTETKGYIVDKLKRARWRCDGGQKRLAIAEIETDLDCVISFLNYLTETKGFEPDK